MSNFYVNKYPIAIETDTENKPTVVVDPGNIFTLSHIYRGLVYLKPLNKNLKVHNNGFLIIESHVIDFAFTVTDQLDPKEIQ